MHGEDHLCLDYRLLEVMSILSSKPYIGNDEPTNLKGNEQTRSSKANGAVDEVARYALSEDGTSRPDLKLEIQKFLGIEEFHTFLIQGNASWITLILSYLKDR